MSELEPTGRWSRASCLGLALLLLSSLAIITFTWSGPTSKRIESEIDLVGALSSGAESFREVTPGRQFRLPEDHGSHPGFKTEWWYLTGHLMDTETSREFGYQFTVFTSGLPPQSEPSLSAWSSDRLVMGHLGLSDLGSERFFSWERFSRGALGLAGVRGFKVWIEDWVLERDDSESLGRWSLQATEQHPELGEVRFDLTLEESKPVVLQGEGGYSRKGPLPQHASYYIAITRLQTTGTLSIADQAFQVAGQSWYDHEWSSEPMAEGVIGWDWFSLQFDDESELMLYLLRREDGTVESASSGSYIEKDGTKVGLALDQFSVEVLETHRSPTGRDYPSRWRIEVPSRELRLEVVPRLADQEMSTGVIYWEGAVAVSGSNQGRPLKGLGFVEMTGY